MSLEMKTDIAEPLRPQRSISEAILRGARRKCPCCGEGALLTGYVTVKPTCESCGEALHHQRADDFPAYVVMMIVGHIVVPAALLVEQLYRPAIWIHMAVWLPLALVLALALLPVVKGAVVGWQWASFMHGFGLSSPDRHAEEDQQEPKV